jgi:antitoxin (DNA-binding transcriptional repressor) of toxin-antitoxin stability system
MHQIDLEQAKAEVNRLLETALEGEEVVITRDDKPVLRLVRVNGVRRHSGSARGKICMSEDFDKPLEDFAEYTE